tara:strand:- start:91 stop:327 length:237 start_codon:yes stop_codon:yes gene_type:complete
MTKYMELFRELEDEEVEEFKVWARENYTPFSEIKGVWHPVIQQECIEINKESDVDLFDDKMRLQIMKQKTQQADAESN